MSRRCQPRVPWAAAGLLLALMAVGVAARPNEPAASPAPFRLVALAPAEVPAALGRVEQGTLVRMPTADFERLARPAKPEPAAALLTARYRARLTVDGAGSRLAGTGELVVRSPGPGAALVLPAALSPVRQAKWSDGRDAVLFKPARDEHPRVVAPAAGDLVLNLEWSARGVAEPAEMRFDLRLPTSPVASLDLELPPGYVPVVPPDEALLTGPYPADAGAAWRLAFGGTDRLALVLRRVGEGHPRLFAKLIAWQRITGGDGAASYDFQIDSAKAGFTDLEFTFDAGLTPTAVRANNLAGWAVAIDPGPTHRLSVRLSEPTRSAKVEVTGTTAAPGAAPWVSPALALKDAISRGERLQVSVAPALRLRDWRPGDYRLVKAEGGLDGSYLLDVEPAPLPAGRTVPTRPSLVVTRPADRAWKADQRAEWNVRPGDEDWSVRTTVTVTTGAVSVVAFRVPDGWSADRVEVNGVEGTADVSAGQLTVDLGRAVSSGDTVEVTTRFRRRHAVVKPGAGVPFPDLTPVAAAGRDGRLIIRVDPALDAVPTDEREETRPATGPVGSTPGTFERSLSSEPLVGKLYCQLRPARPIAEVRSEVRAGPRGSTARVTLTVRPGGGALAEIPVWVPIEPSGPFVWRDALGRRTGHTVRQPAVEAVRWLVGLGARTPLNAVVMASLVRAVPGTCWSIRLPGPVTEPITLTTEYPLDGVPADAGPWVLGIPFSGTVRTTDEAGGRTRKYGPGGVDREVTGDEPPPVVDGLRLITAVTADGQTETVFRFHIRGANRTPMPVRLPGRVRLRGVSVAGRRLPVSEVPELRIPIARSDDWTEVEIRYAGPDPGRGWFGRPEADLPQVPFDVSAVRRIWHVSPAWRVVSRAGFTPVPGTTRESAGLPLPDWRAVAGLNPVSPSVSGVPLPNGAGHTLQAALRGSPSTAQAVLDTNALMGAGVAMDSPLAGGESLDVYLADRGLVLVPIHGAPVLTSAADARRLRTDEAMARAVADVAVYGRDASGRFRAVGPGSLVSPDPPAPDGWGVWFVDDPAAAGPLLIRDDILLPSAWGFAVGLVLLAMALRNRPRVRFGLVVVWSGLALGGTVLGQDAVASWSRPLLFGAIAAGLLTPFRFRAPRVADRPSRRLELTGGAVALVLAAGAYAAEPVPVVYQLPADDGRPSAVLIPPKLIAQMRRPGEFTVPAVIDASYEGTRTDSVCRFHARLRVWAFADGPARLTLPFQSVKLREIRLDGAEAGGVTIGPEGLSVPVSGHGDHVLEVRFEVPIGATATDREARFSIPEVPITRLKFESPKSAPKVRLGPWRGGIRTSVVGDTEHLEVDLGMASAIQLRWPVDGSGNSAALRAREAAVWHVGGGAARLESLTELRVTGVGPSEVQFAVPAAAEVFRVGVRTDGPAAGGSPPRIQAWSLSPAGAAGGRTLTVSFLSPLEGRAVLELEMYATGRWVDRPVLPVPRLLRVAEVESHAAVAVSLTAGALAVEATGLTEVPVDGFLRSVWTPLGGIPLRIARAYRAAGPAQVVPTIPSPAKSSGVATDLTWWVEETRLVGRGTSRIPGVPGLGLVEWRAGEGVRVTDVTGPRLVSWAQDGDRVQAWFDRPVLDGTIRWAAEVQRASPGGETTIPAPDFGPTSITTVRVRPTGGLALGGRAVGEPVAPTSPGEVAWRTSGAGPGRLTVWAPVNARLPVETIIRRADKDLEAVTLVDLTPLRRDRPHRLSISVTGADRSVAVVSGSGVAATEVPSESGGRRWEVSVSAGRTSDGVTVVVRRPDGKWPVPKVTVRTWPGAVPDTQRSVKLETAEATLADGSGLSRTGPTLWRVNGPGWEATVVRGATESGPSGRHVTGVIQAARAGGQWVHLGRFNFISTGSEAGRVTLPPTASGLAASIDGVPQPHGPSTIVIPAAPGAHSVVFRWATPQPTWTGPRFETPDREVVSGPIDWIVSVPPDLVAEGEVRPLPELPTEVSDEDLFRRARLVQFQSETGVSPGVRLVPPSRRWVEPTLAFGLWAGFAILLVWPTRFRPERAAAVGALGGVAFGPAGAGFWLVPVGAILYRLGSTPLARRRRAKSAPQSVA